MKLLVRKVKVAGCGKSRLASALMGREKEKGYRKIFGVGEKTVTPKVRSVNLTVPLTVITLICNTL